MYDPFSLCLGVHRENLFDGIAVWSLAAFGILAIKEVMVESFQEQFNTQFILINNGTFA